MIFQIRVLKEWLSDTLTHGNMLALKDMLFCISLPGNFNGYGFLVKLNAVQSC